ncbi:hypothetical protein DFH07DRAFT_781594 [Mycena maculata]|uniref:Uncharacterized protein n=1 Tax=Mycena maculata TaxID=230809 RepID=A0AAD7HYX2_9AGAR|nr:hypothetical protein DFH07DRAFT_781594 [Mycena maculata]
MHIPYLLCVRVHPGQDPGMEENLIDFGVEAIREGIAARKRHSQLMNDVQGEAGHAVLVGITAFEFLAFGILTARPSPDSAVTVLAVPEYEGFGGIDSIVPIGTAAAGDVTTYELIRTTGRGETDAETATLIESSGGYNLTWAPVITESGANSFTTDTFAEQCNFIGGGQASCGQAPGGTFAPTTAAIEALITFGAVSSATSNTNPASTSVPSAGSGTGPAVDPSRTTGVASGFIGSSSFDFK